MNPCASARWGGMCGCLADPTPHTGCRDFIVWDIRAGMFGVSSSMHNGYCEVCESVDLILAGQKMSFPHYLQDSFMSRARFCDLEHKCC